MTKHHKTHSRWHH